jgi:hypothetical protein
MIRARVAALMLTSACNSTVIVQAEGGGGSGGDGSSGPSTGSGDTSSSSSSSPWTVPPDRGYSSVICGDEPYEPMLFVEIWPVGAGCLAPPDLWDGIILLGIQKWDGSPGTFTVDVETPHGVAIAGLSDLSDEVITGTITVEPFEGAPSAISWDLSIGAGRTDLSVCGHFENFPCK